MVLAVAAVVVGSWSTAPPLVAARSAHAVVAAGATVYVLGGSGAGGTPLGVERFDGKRWSVATTLPGDGLNAPAAVALGGRIYLIGGFAGTTNLPLDAVRVHDPSSRTWSSAAPLPAPRGGHAAVVLGGKIHVLGGGNSVSTIADHSVYDPGTESWSEAAPLPRAEGSPAAVVFGGKLYVIGGRSGSSDYGDVYVYDAAQDTWTRPVDPAARDGGRRRLPRRDLSVRRRVAGLREDAERRAAIDARREGVAPRERAADRAQLRACGRLPRCGVRRRRQPLLRGEPLRGREPDRRAVLRDEALTLS
jgi:hypothetical protein